MGVPVRARQGDWRYHSSRFLRRHFLEVLGVAALVVGLAAIAGVTLWQNHRIEFERQATAQERDHAQQVSAFFGRRLFRKPIRSMPRAMNPRPGMCSIGARNAS